MEKQEAIAVILQLRFVEQCWGRDHVGPMLQDSIDDLDHHASKEFFIGGNGKGVASQG